MTDFLASLDARERLLAATLAPGVGAETLITALLANPANVADPPGLATRAAHAWRKAQGDAAFAARFAAERAALRHLDAWFATPIDADWPAGLPAGVLRGVGEWPVAAGVAIVGARGADPYGCELAGRIARAAVERGRTVVSGGAFGIDHAAHRAALDAGGRTVVVLGSGLDRASPAAHRGLFADAARAGAVVTPFACGQTADKWTFPRRNPWIAGLADVVIVVQASARSGALQTARAALASSRPVYVVPGPMDSPLHQGAHALVGEGARLLLHEAAWAHEAPPRVAGPATPPFGLALWRAAGVEPRPLDALAAEASLPATEAAELATLLELDGWLRGAPGGRFARATPTRRGA
ncbi:MAG: DNA-processing protein DprA [Myxococcales bacterium]|nr:DNA-processing protein DprA [Myxococcales bacterium]